MRPALRRRILEAVRALDDRSVPIAETNRRVGRVAERLGLPKPSYVHLRRLIKAERRRQDEVREIVNEVTRDLIRGVRVDPYDVADQLRDARR